MSRTIIVQGGIVKNIIVATLEEAQSVAPGAICLDEALFPGTQIGQRYEDGQIIPLEPEPSIEDLRAQVQQAATDKRWEVMTGGLTLPGGIEVGTTIDDQNRITSVVANAALAGLTDADEVDFKATSGWVRITIGEVKAIAGAIGQFVQACYTAERAHHEAIELLDTIQAVRDYDVDDGWPDPVIETESP